MIGLMMLATALAPTGAWSVNYQEGTCVLSRSFGDPNKPVIFGIRQIPLSTGAEVVVASPPNILRGPANSLDTMREGRATLAFAPTASSVGGFYTSYILSTGRRSTSFLVEALSLEAMGRAGIVTISLDDQVSISLAPTATAAALRALGDCKTG